MQEHIGCINFNLFNNRWQFDCKTETFFRQNNYVRFINLCVTKQNLNRMLIRLRFFILLGEKRGAGCCLGLGFIGQSELRTKLLINMARDEMTLPIKSSPRVVRKVAQSTSGE